MTDEYLLRADGRKDEGKDLVALGLAALVCFIVAAVFTGVIFVAVFAGLSFIIWEKLAILNDTWALFRLYVVAVTVYFTYLFAGIIERKA